MGWRPLVKGYIANIFISLGLFGFWFFWQFLAFWNFVGFWVYANQSTVLCKIGELVRGGSVHVAVGKSDRWQVSCSTWPVTRYAWDLTCDNWHLTPDMWQLTTYIFLNLFICFWFFSGLILLVLVWKVSPLPPPSHQGRGQGRGSLTLNRPSGLIL